MAPAPPPVKALLSAEAVKAGADMRRCLEALGENLLYATKLDAKKMAVLLGLLGRLLSRDDGHAAGVARAEFYQHGGVEVLGAVLRQRPVDAAVNFCVANLLPKLENGPSGILCVFFFFAFCNFSIFLLF